MANADPTRTGESDRPNSASPAIGPIPTLPIYLKLAGRHVLLAGGSLAAVWKAQLLVAAGAMVTVCDRDPCPEMIEFARHAGVAVELAERSCEPADFKDCAVAVGALEGRDAIEFRDAARRAGVPVNVVDTPELCDFQFGTIIARSPLLIGISTDGGAPVLGQALRARIEALLPPTIPAWVQAAKNWRPDLQSRGLGFAARRRYWEVFADLALDSGRPPTEADRASCLREATEEDASPRGSLTLVGVGPGDPDLVTLRAVRALQSADILIHEPEVNAEILNLGRREALRRSADPQAETALAEISALVRNGSRVAWVGLGDPSAGCNWATRKQGLVERTTPFEIVRGLGS